MVKIVQFLLSTWDEEVRLILSLTIKINSTSWELKVQNPLSALSENKETYAMYNNSCLLSIKLGTNWYC